MNEASTRGTTPTPVTDNGCLVSPHQIAVTARAQDEADRRNHAYADELEEVRTTNPHLYALMRMLDRTPTNVRDVLCEWATRDASICTECHGVIASNEPVMIERREDDGLVFRYPDVLHLDCASCWRISRSIYCWTCSRLTFTYGVGPRRYCCENCREIAAGKRHEADKPIRTCQHCGAAFTGRTDARYCGTRCRVAAHRAKSAPPLARTSATSATPQHPAVGDLA